MKAFCTFWRNCTSSKVINNAGVLYNIGPAGLGYKGAPREDPGTPEYILGTLTPRGPGTDATYNDDLLFDRLMGNNDLRAARPPEQPQQRPFDYFNVLDQMATLKRTGSGAAAGTNLTASLTIDSLAYGFLKGGTAHLSDFQNQADGKGNFGLLNPTIAGGQIDEKKHQLTLIGTFGSDPETDWHAVLIGTKDMTVQTTWTPN